MGYVAGPGRPLLSPLGVCINYSVSGPSADREYLLRRGGGNVSRGVRRVIRDARALRHELAGGPMQALTLIASLLEQDILSRAELAVEVRGAVAEMLEIIDSAGGA